MFLVSDLLSRLRAALSGRYTIERELGRGGMAVVYLARDDRHARLVAIKVLDADLSVALGAERFQREIAIAASLTHPNIVPLYEAGEADGSLYYVMPYVEGETLRERMEREKQLPVEDAIRIACEIASALDYAHRRGVLHRDVKPANILLEDGHAVIADFGIARAISRASQEEALTVTGVTLGTPTYMSPEQASGEVSLDARSDIYALGCVVYEMLVGQPPFTGPSAQAVMARHAMETVPGLRIVRETIPDEVEYAVHRALAKSPADRFVTAQQFAEALTGGGTGAVFRQTATRAAVARRRQQRTWTMGALAAVVLLLGGLGGRWLLARNTNGGGTSDPEARRLAVLYFEDASPGGQLRFLADGLTEELIEQLSQVPELQVVSRNGVAQFRESGVQRDSIARALGAGTLILGTVEPVGTERVRVTTRLVDGPSGADFGERASFVMPRADLLAVRDSVTQDIVDFLRLRLGGELQLRERRMGTRSADAFAMVLRAERLRKEAQELRHHSADSALATLRHADSLLRAAAGADPVWVEPSLLGAWIGYDGALMTQANATRRLEWADLALRHAERALELAPNDPRGREARGTMRYVQALFTLHADQARRTRLLDEAFADIEAAVRARPSLSRAQAMLSLLYHDRKDIVSSVLAARNAYEADAYLRNASLILLRLFEGSYNLGQFAEAQRWCREGMRRFPADHRIAMCQLWMLVIPDARPAIDDAWRLLALLDSVTPAHGGELHRRIGRMIVGGALARAGLPDSARHVLVAARAGHEVDPHQELLGYEAVMRAMLGDADTAITQLKRYVAANPGHSFQVGGNVHWWWQSLRTHPGFADVLSQSR